MWQSPPLEQPNGTADDLSSLPPTECGRSSAYFGWGRLVARPNRMPKAFVAAQERLLCHVDYRGRSTCPALRPAAKPDSTSRHRRTDRLIVRRESLATSFTRIPRWISMNPSSRRTRPCCAFAGERAPCSGTCPEMLRRRAMRLEDTAQSRYTAFARIAQ